MDSTVVMEIENGVSKSADNIKNIAKVHHVKYLNENGKLFYHVWQYYGIGKGKKFPVGPLPIASNYTVSIPFEEDHVSYGLAMATKKNNKIPIHCSEPMCTKLFGTVDKMLHHLDYEEHEYDTSKNVSQLSKVSDKWVQRFSSEKSGAQSATSVLQHGTSSYSSNLGIG